MKYRGTWVLSGGSTEPGEAKYLTLAGLYALVKEAIHKGVPDEAVIFANIVSGSSAMAGFTAKTEEEK